MPQLRVNGYDITYGEAGTGVPLVLVHGTLCDYRYWAWQLAAFGKSNRAIAPSLRYYFPGRWEGGGDMAAEHIADMVAFIAALGAGPVHLLGHSRGGYVAFGVARQAPELLRSLILADPGAALDQELAGGAAPASGVATLIADCAELVKSGDIDGALRNFCDGINGPGGWDRVPEIGRAMMRDNASTLIGQARERRVPLSRAALSAVKMPTLLINGAQSARFFHAIADAMLRHMPAAQQVMIEGAGHTMNVEQPAAFNAAVTAFLATH